LIWLIAEHGAVRDEALFVFRRWPVAMQTQNPYTPSHAERQKPDRVPLVRSVFQPKQALVYFVGFLLLSEIAFNAGRGLYEGFDVVWERFSSPSIIRLLLRNLIQNFGLLISASGLAWVIGGLLCRHTRLLGSLTRGAICGLNFGFLANSFAWLAFFLEQHGQEGLSQLILSSGSFTMIAMALVPAVTVEVLVSRLTGISKNASIAERQEFRAEPSS
jgi:hypothetical protein